MKVDHITTLTGRIEWHQREDGFWAMCEYDKKGNEIFAIKSTGEWEKWTHNADGMMASYQNSSGTYKRYVHNQGWSNI